MSFWDFILICVVAFLIVVPPRWDPAIRIKEWVENGKKKK